MTCPKLVSDLFTPKMMWYQTDLTVTIRILLQDVKDYFLRVEPDLLLFSTTVKVFSTMKDKDYYICLNLFGTVVAEDTTHTNLGREIKVCLVKAHKWVPWLRLQIEQEKNQLIVADRSRLYEPCWVTEERVAIVTESVEEYKRKNNIQSLKLAVPSSDEEESEDDAMDELFW